MKNIFHPTKNILDIGVGNGNILVNIGKKLNINSNHLFGIDVLNYSENKNFNYVQYNKNLIPLESNSIGLILIMMVLHHTDEPKKVLMEAHRVLSDSGCIIVRETDSYHKNLLEFNILIKYIFYEILLEIPIKITNNYLDKNKWEFLFKDVGFKYTKVKENKLENDPFTSVYYILKK